MSFPTCFVSSVRSVLNKDGKTFELGLGGGCPFIKLECIVFFTAHYQRAVAAKIQHSLLMLFKSVIALLELQLPGIKVAVEGSRLLADLYGKEDTRES